MLALPRPVCVSKLTAADISCSSPRRDASSRSSSLMLATRKSISAPSSITDPEAWILPHRRFM